MPGQTCLYSGASSDQDRYLLRHLPFNRDNRFGKRNWHVWRLGENPFDSAYFTVWIFQYPTYQQEESGLT